jgi:hypothetical protein
MVGRSPEEIARQVCTVLKSGRVDDPRRFKWPHGWTPEEYSAGLQFALTRRWITLPNPNDLTLTEQGRRIS